MLGSVKLDMVRATLPENQSPVLSNVGGGHVRKGSFNNYTSVPKIDESKETIIMHCNKITTKELNG